MKQDYNQLYNDSFFYRHKGIYIRVKKRDICYVEANGDYVSLFLKNSERVLLRQTISALEEKLSSDIFFRVHRSFLINMKEVTAYDVIKKAVFLDKTSIPVSRANQNFMLKLFDNTL